MLCDSSGDVVSGKGVAVPDQVEAGHKAKLEQRTRHCEQGESHTAACGSLVLAAEYQPEHFSLTRWKLNSLSHLTRL